MLFLSVLVFAVISARGSELKPDNADHGFVKLLENGGMHVGSGRTKRFVQIQQNKPNIPYQECYLPDGTPGHCRHLHYCMQDDFKDNMMKMADYLCVIEGNSVGVCCPDDYERSLPQTLAGDLPATALREEDNNLVLARIAQSENRGCGVSTRAHTRLVGAKPTSVREWPWIAFVIPEGFEQYCGGTLITDQHVITAAHCTRRWKAEELFVRLGEYDFHRNDDSRTYTFRVVDKRQHADFDNVTYQHDIAILKMHRPAVFNTYVWPVCLPPPGLDLTNETAVVIGWGTSSFGGPSSNVLMEVSVPVWDLQMCASSLTDSVFEENICAAGYEGGRDACQGDSGGPLMYQMASGRWALIGVVSWGIRCGEPTHPGVYTRVDRYLPWIIQNALF